MKFAMDHPSLLRLPTVQPWRRGVLLVPLIASLCNCMTSAQTTRPTSPKEVVATPVLDEKPRLTIAEGLAKAAAFVPGPVELHYVGPTSWGDRLGAGLNCLHFEGPAAEGLWVDVDSTSGKVCDYHWIRLQSQSVRVNLNFRQAQTNAEKFVSQHYSILTSPGIKSSPPMFHDHGDGGKEYSIEWTKEIDGIQYPFSLDVNVSAQTGLVVGLLYADHEIRLPSLVPHITKSQAMAAVARRLEYRGAVKIEARLRVGRSEAGQVLLWHVTEQGDQVLPFDPDVGQFSVPCISECEVNATTGVVAEYVHTIPVPGEVPVRIRAAEVPQSVVVFDSWPVFDKSSAAGILFVTTRGLRRDAQMIASSDGKSITGMYAVPDSILCFEKLGDKRLVLSSSSFTSIVDTVRGTDYQVPNRDTSTQIMASASGGGTYAVFVEDGGGASGANQAFSVVMYRVPPANTHQTVGSREVLVSTSGSVACPMLSPDNGRLIYGLCSAADIDLERRWKLVVSDVSIGNGSGGQVRIKTSEARTVASGLGDPERISWFPDGRRAMVSFYRAYPGPASPPIIIDTVSRRVTPWLPHLVDRSLKRALMLAPGEVCVASGSDLLAFSALLWNGDPDSAGAHCIYTCSLNGSKLKRITPPSIVPIKLHQYPGSGVDVVNAWDKLRALDLLRR